MLRRAFLKRAVVGVQGVIALLLAAPAVRFLLEPLVGSARRKARFHRVMPLSALDVGVPTRHHVVAERSDAFTRHPPGSIGQVFLIRENGEEGVPQVRCLQTICPHLGCALDHSSGSAGFTCPCHASTFDATGKRVTGPAPRDLDELACRVVGPDVTGEPWVEVRYEVFQAGLANRRPVA